MAEVDQCAEYIAAGSVVRKNCVLKNQRGVCSGVEAASKSNAGAKIARASRGVILGERIVYQHSDPVEIAQRTSECILSIGTGTGVTALCEVSRERVVRQKARTGILNRAAEALSGERRETNASN